MKRSRPCFAVGLLLLLAGLAYAQVQPANPRFESGELGQAPPGWLIPPVVEQAGFSAKVVNQGCRTGKCVMMTGVANPPPNMFGNVMQTLPATGYNLRRIRLRSAVRVQGENTRAQMWLRLDRSDNSMALLENMNSRPIVSSEWKTYDIETEVPADVSRIVLGVMLFGSGKAWVDDVSLEILGEIKQDAVEPARPLSTRGRTNLIAFAKLYGYVRFFHPSDQVATADWDTLAIDGVREVESASSDEELAGRLEKFFAAIAPTVQVFVTAKPPRGVTLPKGPQTTRWKHNGVGLPSVATYSPYRSTRERQNVIDGKDLPVFEREIVPGVTARVPLALYADTEGTVPHAPKAGPPPLYSRSGDDRATRLADVIIVWNVMQHFYPYFDVVKTDWAAELPKALDRAATDRDGDAFEATLDKLVAALHDGHGRVGPRRQTFYGVAPVTLDWIEDAVTVTRVLTGKAEGIAPGDRALSVEGVPIAKAVADARERISAATEQWMRYRIANELSRCNSAEHFSLVVEPYSAPKTTKEVNLTCLHPQQRMPEAYTESRPMDKVAEVAPGIIYVDLDRVSTEEFNAAIPRLEKAKGIIFDMRGYPGQPAIGALAHLTDTTIRCARWNIPEVTMPDRIDMKFNESGWDVTPQKPYFSAKRAFLTDGRAISYAETVMGIVENYKLGEIVGGPTAGTNGNVNPFKLPGGYTVMWTGMKVLKHDKSQHHGVGIQPTIGVARTRKGVAKGKDELLGRAIEVVSC